MKVPVVLVASANPVYTAPAVLLLTTTCAIAPFVPSRLFQPVRTPSSEANRNVALVPLGRAKPVAVPVEAAPVGEPVAVVPPEAAGILILNASAGGADGVNGGKFVGETT